MHRIELWWLMHDMLKLGPKELEIVLDEKLSPWGYKRSRKRFRLGPKLHDLFWEHEDSDELWFESN